MYSGTCDGCKTTGVELCSDGCCATCHKGVAFEDCRDGTLSAWWFLRSGLHVRSQLQEWYPNADWQKIDAGWQPQEPQPGSTPD